MPRSRALTDEQRALAKAAYLEAVRRAPQLTGAKKAGERAAGVTNAAVHYWRRTDPAFDDLVTRALSRFAPGPRKRERNRPRAYCRKCLAPFSLKETRTWHGLCKGCYGYWRKLVRDRSL